MSSALEQALPGFTPWRLSDYGPDIRQYYTFTDHQAPWAVIGDFNGDHFPDVVIDGHTGNRSYRVCLLSVDSRDSVRLLELAVMDGVAHGDRATVLLFQGPGVVGTNFDDSTLRLATDAFHDYYFDKAGTLYYWQVDHFAEFTSSD